MKNHWRLAVLMGATFVLAQTSGAAEPVTTRPGWELGIQGSRYHYEQPDTALDISGRRGGVVAAYTEVDDRLFTRIDARYSYGRLTYDNAGAQAHIPDHLFEARAVTGADFVPGGWVSISPYIGLGYRYVDDDARGYATDSTGASLGYRRYSQYVYVPVGVTLRLGAGGFALAPNLEYDGFISGRQRNKLTDMGAAQDQDFDQRHGRGYRASLMIESGHLAFGPWAHYWRVRDSDVNSAGLVEPASRTREYGIEVRYRF